jgi:hypothetical protein
MGYNLGSVAIKGDKSMNWMLKPILGISMFSTISFISACEQHGLCESIDGTDRNGFVCSGGKFSTCMRPKFECSLVAGCENYA